MTQQPGIGVSPLVHFIDGDDERVTRLEWGDRQKRGALLVLMDEVTG